MKLFLSSLSIPSESEFVKLFDGKKSPKIGVIANAWGTYDHERSQPYIDAIENRFKAMGMSIEKIDLLDYTNKQELLDRSLDSFDGVWVTGGNTYYLNWCVRQSGFHEVISKHCKRGLVYGGESAGAIIAGPTLNHFQSMDNPNDAPEIILEGIGLTNVVIVPHADNAKYGKILVETRDMLDKDGFETILLTDNEVAIIDDSIRKIAGVTNL